MLRTRAARWSLLLSLALVASAASADDVEIGEILKSGTKLYSQDDEELIIRDFFDDRRGGVFVDVGSWRPRKASTTYYLEQHLGWSGLAIDAQPGLAEAYATFRPRTKFFQYIVSDVSGATQTLYLSGPVSSTDKDHHKAFKGFAAPKQAVEVETITLNDLLEREGIEAIDFLSMDIEKGEPPALRGFDIERYRPALVCIESQKGEVRAALVEYFADHGYERIEAYRPYDARNWYYRPKPAKADAAASSRGRSGAVPSGPR